MHRIRHTSIMPLSISIDIKKIIQVILVQNREYERVNKCYVPMSPSSWPLKRRRIVRIKSVYVKRLPQK
jgi:hypothetical protein